MSSREMKAGRSLVERLGFSVGPTRTAMQWGEMPHLTVAWECQGKMMTVAANNLWVTLYVALRAVYELAI